MFATQLQDAKDVVPGPSKRFRTVNKVVVESLDELLQLGDEVVGDSLELRCYIDLETLLECIQLQGFWSGLRDLEIAPPFNDVCISPVLRLSHPLLSLPCLERLAVKNHAVSIVRFNSAMFPRLRIFELVHPLGITVDIFDVCCPATLEKVVLEYVSVRDGYGLSKSLSPRTNPRLNDVKKFATITFYQGIV